MLDTAKFRIHICCGKVMHTKCAKDFHGSKLSLETKNSCPWCRAKVATKGTKEEIRRLRKWSQKNKRWAQFMLGNRYDEGVGVPQDDKRACMLYKLVADQGHHLAQYNLGNRYKDGRGVIQSDTLAFKYLKLSAETGDAEAQCNVGTYYAKGTGVEQSYTKARVWWAKAATQEQETAIENLKKLDEIEGIKTTSSNFTDNSSVLCSKCNKPAQTNRTLRKCKCKGVQYCNNTCYRAHWKEHKAEHNRLVELLPSTGETKEEPTEDKKKSTDEKNNSKTKKQKPNDRCACGSKKKYKKCCGSKKR